MYLAGLLSSQPSVPCRDAHAKARMHVTVEFSIQEAPNSNIDFNDQSALLHRRRMVRKHPTGAPEGTSLQD